MPVVHLFSCFTFDRFAFDRCVPVCYLLPLCVLHDRLTRLSQHGLVFGGQSISALLELAFQVIKFWEVVPFKGSHWTQIYWAKAKRGQIHLCCTSREWTQLKHVIHMHILREFRNVLLKGCILEREVRMLFNKISGRPVVYYEICASWAHAYPRSSAHLACLAFGK